MAILRSRFIVTRKAPQTTGYKCDRTGLHQFLAEKERRADALREAAQITDESSRKAQYLHTVRAAACEV